MTIQPIETYHAGYRFRSRTEARWAVFFDHLKIRWQYEAQGYELDNGDWYLPDFWLPEMGIHVEVKGAITPLDADKIVGISKDQPPGSYPTLVLSDIPRDGALGPHFIAVGASFTNNSIEFWHVSLLRSTCGRVLTAPFGWPRRVSSNPYSYDPIDWETANAGFVVDQYEIKEAYSAARMARFEHSERGVA